MAVGTTVMVPIPTLLAVKLIPPVPLEAKPMAVLELVQEKTALLVPAKTTVTGVPEQAVWLTGSTTVGAGLTVIVKFTGIPEHVPMVGVAVIVAICWLLTPPAIKERSPLPLALRPMLVLEFIHVNDAPLLPVNTTPIEVPAQATTLAGTFMVGAGVTVRVKFCGVPVQPFSVGVTTKFPVVDVTTVEAIKLMFPEPEVPRPISILEFVQL